MKHALKNCLLALGLAAFCASPYAVFDPVNDDTDLFRNNPNIPSERPNILIILDNTANWNNAFTNEKAALVSVINGLDSAFNVGWMMYPETGGGNDSIDGAYVRFGIRQMTATNKAALSTMVNAFDNQADKGNNSTLSLAMHEAYLYFSGRASRASFGKVKTDFAGNTANNPNAAALPGNALPANPTSASLYTAGIGADCQKSYIIYISNGPANENSSSLSTAEGLLTTAMGTAPSIIAITPNGQQNNWADEYAKFMAESDISSARTGTQNVFTYTVEVDPGSQNQDLAMTALMKSMAQNGKGKYFSVTSADAGANIVLALQAIFTEIQAVNSVFAASTLPVSVNVRGTNLNQLYIGVFRPDAADRPRWLGNLKAYQLKLDSVTNTVFTVDANLNPAINSSTGFITSNAKSFWTSATAPTATYWGFRSADVNGVGGSSDSPDGDLVEKGGAAQQLRARYFAAGVNGVSPSPSRPLYTCTQGTPVCKTNDPSNPSLLSDTPFSTANAAIDATALSLDSRAVTPLTAKVTKSVSALADTRAVSLDNSVAPITVTSITRPTSGVTVTLGNSTSIAISTMSNGAVALSGTCKKSANNVAKVVFSSAHGLSNGATVIVAVPTDSSSKFISSGAIITVSSPTTEFTYPASGLGNPADIACTVTSSNTTTTVTLAANHGYTVGSSVSVTIAGASPSQYSGTKTVSVTGANSYTFSNTVSAAPTLTAATSTGSSTTVTATKSSGTFTGGTYSAGQQVTISGDTSGAASPPYNNTYTIVSGTSTTFTFTTSSAITIASAGTITATQGGVTATATTATPHGFTDGQTITMSNILPDNSGGYNGTKTIACTPAPACAGATTFTYTIAAGQGTASGNPTMQAASGTGATVTATLAAHGFAVSDVITIAGATTASHNGSFTVLTVPGTSTFTYTPGGVFAAPGGSPTVRLTSNPKAYATITGHGYGANGGTVGNFSITGALPAGYNVSNVTATIVDANTVRYDLSAALGTNTGASVTASTFGTTARATSTAHGYITGATVQIAGASPSEFNGTKTITTTGVDTFEYTLATAQGDASGVISVTSTGGATSERDNVINWIRGEDNFEDENANSSFNDTRASMHGDVLHSRPSVVNYNRRASDTSNIDNDVYIYYGGNDGVFRAVKGGFGSTTGDPAMGVEVWGFVAKDHFASLKRLRLNSPAISSSYKKPFFFDGPLGAYTLDANGDGMLDPDNARAANGTVSAASTGDKVWLFLTMRRGGRAIYALDVSRPLAPKMLWRKGCPSYSTNAADIDATTGCDLGFSELGQTWSEPKVVSVVCSTAPCGTTDPVLIFGAGYDPLVEDLDPATITSSTATTVVSSGTTYTRSMGRGLFVVNAATGALIWHASPKAAGSVSMPTGATYKQVTGMDYAIPSDIAVVVGDPTPKPFRAYVGDTGGNMWRFDFGNSNPNNWSVVKLASIADQTTTVTGIVNGSTLTYIPGLRKFQFAPDVIGSTGFDMVITGSGDREHPFDSTVVNRVYAFKDKQQTSSPVDGGGVQIQPAIVHATSVTFNSSSVKALLDVSTQCIEIPGACSGTPPEIAVSPDSASTNTSKALTDSTNLGWFITLAAGEKQVGSTLASGSGVVQFGTNQPSASAGGGACSPNLGVARQYTVNFLDGTAYNGTALSTQYVGGGFLPSPVLVFVGLGGAAGTGSTSTTGVGVGGTITSGSSQLGIGAGASAGGSDNVATAVVCYGASCSIAPGTVLFSRVRKFWYKEID